MQRTIHLVQYTDGEDGTKRRIVSAGHVVQNFGIATKGGFGRRDPGAIPMLLDIHTSVFPGNATA